MKHLLTFAALLALAGCGVDGEPEVPGRKADVPEPGIHFSGTVGMGFTGGDYSIGYPSNYSK